MVLDGAAYGRQEDTDQVHLEETIVAMAPGTGGKASVKVLGAVDTVIETEWVGISFTMQTAMQWGGIFILFRRKTRLNDPSDADKDIPYWKLKPPFLVYLLLGLSYLLIIILFGIVISNELQLPSKVRKLHTQLQISTELFPCGSRSREWEYFHGGCYYFSVYDVTWHTARDHCEEKNSTLVVIHDMPKQNFLQSRTRGRNHWIGLNDENTEGEWRWIDGTNYKTGFKHWQMGEPNDHDNGEDCAQIGGLGEWNDMPCNCKAFYVCEKPLLL